MRSADADCRSVRQRAKRRDADLSFLAWLKTAKLDELVDRLRAYRRTRGCPEWRIVAVGRAITKLNQEGTMGDAAEVYCLRAMAHTGLFLPESEMHEDAINALVMRGLCAVAKVSFADGPRTYYRITDAGWRELEQHNKPGGSRLEG